MSFQWQDVQRWVESRASYEYWAEERQAWIECKLDLILAILRQPRGFYVQTEVLAKGQTMATKTTNAASHSVDLQILPNGTVKFTATPIDAAGNTTDPQGNPVVLPVGTPPLTWTSSDPNLQLASDPSDTSGFNLLQIGTAVGTFTGATATCSTTLPNGTTPITGVSDPVDAQPAPDLPAGFRVTEAAG